MKKLISLLLILSCLGSVQAQLSLNGYFYGQDALKFNSYRNYGTAKVQGMGGAFSALGGDASSAFINPAGLGFYNKSEFSLTPAFGNSNASSTYISIGNPVNTSSSDLKLAQAGVVFSSRGTGSRLKRSAWSLSYNQLANFQSDFNYQGTNNKSSISDYFAQRASARNISSTDLDKQFNIESKQAQNIEALAYQAFLIDPLKDNFYEPSEPSIPVEQSGNVSTKGSLNQINLSYGVNYDNKTYVGIGVGFQNLSHTTLTRLNETFPRGKVFNGFGFDDELYVSGTGLNLSIGAIFKLSESARVGLNLVSPTAMRVSETYQATINIDQKPNTFTTDNKQISTVPNDFSYRITSPLRANAGVSFFLPKKIGALNLEAEYIGYSRMNVKDKEDVKWSENQKAGIQKEFKDVINFKAGTELRFGIIRARAGLNYLSDPRKNQDLYKTKSNFVGSLGAGVRNEKYFFDVAYSRGISKFAYTPYTTANALDYASVSNSISKGVASFSIGTYF